MIEENNINSQQNKLKFDVSKLHTGSYFVQLQINNNYYTNYFSIIR